MQIGLIGLKKKGINLALTLQNKGYQVFAYDLNTLPSDHIQQQGIFTVTSLKDLAESVHSKRIIWLMLPAGELVDVMLDSLTPYLSVGDIVIDGGDSDHRDSMRRAKALEALQVNFLDCGISENPGSVCAMVGGNRFAFNYCESLFNAIAFPDGYVYCGVSGSGHFVSMVHNGIAHGMIQAISNGLDLLQKSEFKLDLEKIVSVWDSAVARDGLIKNALSRHAQQ